MEQQNTTLFPIFEDKSDHTYFRFEYIVENYGEKIDVSKELRPTVERENAFISITSNSYQTSNATQLGWTDGKNNFTSANYLIMPRKNVTLYAYFIILENYIILMEMLMGLSEIQTLHLFIEKELELILRNHLGLQEWDIK